MLLQDHFRFVAYDRDQNCVAEAMPSQMATLARQLLNNDSDFTAFEDVLSTANILINALDGITAKTRAEVWAIPKKLVAVQKFTKHILHFILMY